MAKKTVLDWIAFVLLIIGGLNLGLIAIGVGDVLAYLGETVVMVLGILIGIAALYAIYFLTKK